MTTTINASNSGSGGLVQTADASGILALQTAGTTAVTIDASQNVTLAGTLTTTGYANLPNTFGFKNRIINGAMVIDQRNAGASVSGTTAVYTVDRWTVQNNSGAARFNVQQNVNSVTPPAGYKYYLGVTSTSAYTVASTDVIGVQQFIEGYNIADLAWGTASAAPVALSFWVRSSLTGTFGGSLIESNVGTAFYPFTYTISAANTWEQKTVTIAGPTIGTWNSTNARGTQVLFNLGTGSTYIGTAGAWTANSYYAPTGATNFVATNAATWYVTGVQLEKGSTATSFDYRPYGTELALCQRYFEMSYNIGTVPASANTTQLRLLSWAVNGANGGNGGVTFQVSKRAAPTIASYDGAGTANTVSTSTAAANPSFTNGYAYQGAPGNISTSSFIHWGQGAVGNVYNYIHFTASAEL